MDVDVLNWAANGGLLAAGDWWSIWSAKVWKSLWDPWFVFGMIGQGVFFLRFLVQWIVSERRGESVIPLAFWYLSLVGSLLIFVYAVREAQPLFMLAQLLACVIYVRNLMLIFRQRKRLRARPHSEGGSSGGSPDGRQEEMGQNGVALRVNQ